MRLSFTRRTDYAVRAALELARSSGLATHPGVAAATGAPPSVMKQALADLARAGVAVAVRGRSGGYRLARDPASLTMLELITSLEQLGDDEPRCVLHSGVCRAHSPCPFHHTIAAARAAFMDALSRDTLADVLARADLRGPD
jgi:Rrf2 family transcriptional regulator, nitric oxide-sensitive transcriptional repressor